MQHRLVQQLADSMQQNRLKSGGETIMRLLEELCRPGALERVREGERTLKDYVEAEARDLSAETFAKLMADLHCQIQYLIKRYASVHGAAHSLVPQTFKTALMYGQGPLIHERKPGWRTFTHATAVSKRTGDQKCPAVASSCPSRVVASLLMPYSLQLMLNSIYRSHMLEPAARANQSASLVFS